MSLIDVAIIGGGPAGLTAAGSLVRQLHTAVVFDSKTYRNSRATHMHMVPTWDHQSPEEFRAKARKDILSNYSTVQFVDVGVTRIAKESDSHFKVADANGKEWDVRKVILAVGSSDTYPDIKGYEQLWGRRIFHCLFCHGYEDRSDASSGVLAVAPVSIPALVVHLGETAAQLGGRVNLYTNGDEEMAAQLRPFENATFRVEPRRIQQLAETKDGRSVQVAFEDGSQRQEKFLVHNPQTSVQGPFVEQLGLATTPMGDVQADAPFYQTSVRGVFAAGDCITMYKVIPGAISSGCNAAVGVSAQLQAEKHGHHPMF
ncbi:hypothetical protein F4778DRAFT_727519 [Xylariomycetidae sp. FL2044]|nr:hypothetical protein F4778DRAFT_727519 [Xylariomycetidae sp. FL2044]